MTGIDGVPLGALTPAEYKRLKEETLRNLRIAYHETKEPSLEELRAIVPDPRAGNRAEYAEAKKRVLDALRSPREG